MSYDEVFSNAKNSMNEAANIEKDKDEENGGEGDEENIAPRKELLENVDIKKSKFVGSKVDEFFRSQEDFDRSGFHPSQSYFFCPRKQILQEKHPKDDPEGFSLTLQKICKIGDFIHEGVQWMLGERDMLFGKWFCRNCKEVIGSNSHAVLMPETCPSCGAKREEKYGRVREKNFKYVEMSMADKEKEIYGSTDGRIPIKLDDGEHIAVLEIKSVSPFSVGSIDLVEDYPHYMYQMQLYMYLTGLDYAIIYFIGKSSWKHPEWLVEYDEDIVQDIFDQIEKCKEPVNLDEMDLKSKLKNDYTGICRGMDDKAAKRCGWSDECIDAPGGIGPTDAKELKWD